ncbi:Cyanovirin-N [Peziza echinospora]|nr:Cyanovirin-N [Peziza echinospora]
MAAAAAAASTIYALRDQLHTKSLKLEGTNILVAVIVHGGEEKTSRLDLNTVLQNINGTFKWGVGDFSKTAKNVVLEGSILRALLQNSAKDKDLPAQVDLAEYIFNADGKLKFFQNGGM